MQQTEKPIAYRTDQDYYGGQVKANQAVKAVLADNSVYQIKVDKSVYSFPAELVHEKFIAVYQSDQDHLRSIIGKMEQDLVNLKSQLI